MQELITPVEAYATTDGQLHMTIFDAQVHQAGLDIEDEVRQYMKDRYSNYDMNYFTNMTAIMTWEKHKKAKELSK